MVVAAARADGLCLLQAIISVFLLLGASFSWAESSDSAASYVHCVGCTGWLACAGPCRSLTPWLAISDHANAEWNNLSYNDRQYFNNNVVEMADSYQESALMFGFVAFVGFIIIAVSSCTLLCLCVLLTSPELCGRSRRDMVLG